MEYILRDIKNTGFSKVMLWGVKENSRARKFYENHGFVLTSVCGCKNVSLEDVVNAIKNGADTVEKVGEETGAGTCCGRCKPLVQNVIDLKR